MRPTSGSRWGSRRVTGYPGQPAEGSSSVGRASVSKTDGRGFESLLPCPSHQPPQQHEFEHMSLDDLNREQKRNLRRMGAVDEKGAPKRVQRTAGPKSGRVGPAQYIREVRDEMRKVAWPDREEIVRYSIVVIATVIVYTALVGGLDFGFGFLSEWLYG